MRDIGDERTDKVFGRFSGYSRHASPKDSASPERQGASGEDICAASSRVTRVCQVGLGGCARWVLAACAR
eukprot:366024-Chlamydomonas_euryale.AAC.10